MSKPPQIVDDIKWFFSKRGRLVYLPLIFLLIIGGGLITKWGENWIEKYGSQSKLEIVSLHIKQDGGGTLLDLTVRNIGNKVAVVNELRFDVHHTWILRNKAEPFPVPFSGSYDVLIRNSEHPYTEILPLTHAVPANDVDRISVRLQGAIPPDTLDVLIVEQTLTLHHDQGSSVSQKVPLLLLIGPAMKTFPHETLLNSLSDEGNKSKLKQIRMSDFPRSDWVKIIEAEGKNPLQPRDKYSSVFFLL